MPTRTPDRPRAADVQLAKVGARVRRAARALDAELGPRDVPVAAEHEELGVEVVDDAARLVLDRLDERVLEDVVRVDPTDQARVQSERDHPGQLRPITLEQSPEL